MADFLAYDGTRSQLPEVHFLLQVRRGGSVYHGDRESST